MSICADGVTETFAFGTETVTEAIALENETGWTYHQWRSLLERGSPRALAAFCWLVWRRNGRDVPLSGILAGKPEIDLRGFAVEPGGAP